MRGRPRSGFPVLRWRSPGAGQWRLGAAGASGRVAAVKRALALRQPGTDQYNGGYSLLQLALVYAIAGQRENAMATLDRLVKMPLFVTPGWLRIDPTCVVIQLSPAASPPPPP